MKFLLFFKISAIGFNTKLDFIIKELCQTEERAFIICNNAFVLKLKKTIQKKIYFKMFTILLMMKSNSVLKLIVDMRTYNKNFVLYL